MERGGLTLGKKFLGFTAKQTCWEKKECGIYAQYLNHRGPLFRPNGLSTGRLISQVPPEFLLRVNPPLFLIYSD